MSCHAWRRRCGVLALIGASLLSPSPAGATAARECLDQARAATYAIELPGDQSAARRAVALEIAGLDPRAALDVVATISRPADSARALGAVARGLVFVGANASMAEARPGPGAAPPDATRASPAASYQEVVSTAGRLLARIQDSTRRTAEQRFLLAEIAGLGEKALPAAPELAPEEARGIVTLALARSDPSAALTLMRGWSVSGQVGDEALSVIATRLADSDPEQALKVTADIVSGAVLEQTLWRIAERRPPLEAVAIAGRLQDPVVRAAILTSAAERLAATDPQAALATAREVPIAPESALAEVAVTFATTDGNSALELARSLPPAARAWTTARLALAWAASRPEQAESVLAQEQLPADAFRLALPEMAARDPDRAIRLAQAIADDDERDPVLAAIAAAIAAAHPKQAADLVWSIPSPRWRSRGAEAVARQLAASDSEAALALIGLVADGGQAQRLRADIAGITAPRDLQQAERLLDSLPASYYRREIALEAARSLLLSGRKTEEVLSLARLGEKPDLSLRWLLPDLAWSQQESPLHVAENIKDSYLQSLALVDTARRMLGREAKCRAAPDRLAQVRPIVEWEGR